MVDFAKEAEIVSGVICPKCHGSLPDASIIDEHTDRYERTLRCYFGWCPRCDCGFEVIQFKSGEHWYINKYRYYNTVAGIGGKAQVPGAWQKAYEMPKPAPIVTGPGGDYDEPMELKAGYWNLLKSLQKALESTGKILQELLKVVQK